MRKRGRDGKGVASQRYREGGWRRTVPFWVKFLRLWPEFWIVVDEVDGQVDCHSLGNGDSIDLNCLLSNS